MGRYGIHIRVGILGGGQLARMLVESAHHLGLIPHVLSPHRDDPAAQVTNGWHQGDPNDTETIKKFLRQVDVATFESEFIDPARLKNAAGAAAKIFPQPPTMALLRDRQTQKETLDRFLLTTSPWQPVPNRQDVAAAVASLGLPVVFKKRLHGYDGYGTYIVKTTSQLQNFTERHFARDAFIVEKYIPFARECAIILARSQDGSFCHFPLVESLQKEARCYWVKGPVRSRKIIPMMSSLHRMLKSLNYVGVMAVEFFDGKGGLIVNEVAPRVHNTGHYSQNTEGPSQFDIHWHCLLGHPLPKAIKPQPFAMVNLLSAGPPTPQLHTMSDTWLHWYGKKEHRQGRKMGHINAIGKTPSQALRKALKAEKGLLI